MFKSIAQGISIGVDAAGIAIILFGLLWAIARFARSRGGGIGMAPLMSMLRSLAENGDRRSHILFMANSRLERSTFLEAVTALESRLHLTVVHILEQPPEAWAGERGYITADVLDRCLPANRRDLEYFVCGPTAMIAAVEHGLYHVGVPVGRCHSELFDLV